jgi:formiminoglutamase
MYSKSHTFHFIPYDDVKLKHFVHPRLGESRVGEQLLENNAGDATFVILGINENVGPLANLGKPGAENTFEVAIKTFLNSQTHDGFKAENIATLGHIQQFNWETNVADCSDMVTELDEFVLEILENNILPHQIPIVIGGGHNNALPLMRWAAKHHPLKVINIDPHGDCRMTNSRNSGNSFSFALLEKTIASYGVFGLHEAYNNQFVRDFLKQNNCTYTFYEDYLHQREQLFHDVFQFAKTNDDEKIGLEIDMDAIAYMPSSASSPSGWTVDEIRVLLRNFPNKNKIAYLHFPEGAPQNEIELRIVGKAITYFLRDFLIFS